MFVLVVDMKHSSRLALSSVDRLPEGEIQQHLSTLTSWRQCLLSAAIAGPNHQPSSYPDEQKSIIDMANPSIDQQRPPVLTSIGLSERGFGTISQLGLGGTVNLLSSRPAVTSNSTLRPSKLDS